MAISYWAVINSVEEPFEEQGREKATITGETILEEPFFHIFSPFILL